MKFALHAGPLGKLSAPLLAVPVFADDDDRGAAFAAADARSGGLLDKIASEEGFKPEPGKVLLVHAPGGDIARYCLVGVGKKEEYEAVGMRAFAARVVREANERKLAGVACMLSGAAEAAGETRFAVEGAGLGAYRYDEYLTVDVEPLTCERVTMVVDAADGLDKVVARASKTIEGVVLARDLVNGPPIEVTPLKLAEVAEQIARESGLELQIFDKEEIASRGMNLVMAVNAGSEIEPRFIHLTYRPKGADESTPQVALVGKGLTYDAGGYNLKPTGSLEDMKMDMAGGAAVLGAMKVVAALAPAYIVHGIVPSTENLVSGKAYKPGDIIRSLSGKTVEVMNTDAEGRLILADALCYAERLGVDRIVDLATLTGACMIALGPHTAGVFANDEAFGDKVVDAAKRAGEDVWRLPLSARLRPMLKSDAADVKNIGQRWGGAITAALFLKEFVGDKTWAHLDIAGPAFAEKPEAHTPKGGTGFAVLTLLELLSGEV